MSERIEAAAKAHYQSSPHSDTWEKADPETRQWFLGRIARALSAADEVMFSDEAIERAVDALAALESGPTVHIHPYRRMTLERQARIVVAALKGDA